MTRKAERLQGVWHRYDAEHGHAPSSTRQVVEWAVARGLLRLPSVDPYEALAGEMASAMREEYQTDHRGRRYRANHAVRISTDGVQYTFWARMGFARRLGRPFL